MGQCQGEQEEVQALLCSSPIPEAPRVNQKATWSPGDLIDKMGIITSVLAPSRVWVLDQNEARSK